MQLATIIGILVAVGAVMFALQNNVPVTVNFLIWRFDSSLAMVLLLALASGALMIALVSTPATLRTRWQLRREHKRAEALERENRELRAHRDAAAPEAAQLPATARLPAAVEGARPRD